MLLQKETCVPTFAKAPAAPSSEQAEGLSGRRGLPCYAHFCGEVFRCFTERGHWFIHSQHNCLFRPDWPEWSSLCYRGEVVMRWSSCDVWLRSANGKQWNVEVSGPQATPGGPVAEGGLGARNEWSILHVSVSDEMLTSSSGLCVKGIFHLKIKTCIWRFLRWNTKDIMRNGFVPIQGSQCSAVLFGDKHSSEYL